MTATLERVVPTDAVKLSPIRDNYGVLTALGNSIKADGLRHPIVLWKDGTLISGGRRHRAHMLLGGKHRTIPAIFVDTIEDAAKALLVDNQDDHLALPMKWSEIGSLWELLRRLDEPAAKLRMIEARRRGVELRRLTQAGKRPPGRDADLRGEDYATAILAEPFGVSGTTARRLWSLYSTAYGLSKTPATDEQKAQARASLATIDSGESSIGAEYRQMISGRTARPTRPKAVETVAPADARVQLTAWDRSLPTVEGLVAGLLELGPPNAELTWEQVGPVHARLSKVRRDLEKIINQMRESNKS